MVFTASPSISLDRWRWRHGIGIVAQAVHGQVILDERVIDERQHLAMLGQTLIERLHGALAQLAIRLVEQ